MEGASRDGTDERRALVAAGAATLAAVVIAIWFVRPGAALTGSDAASSVLYFDRIAAGEPLERFLGTTPKPLLTLLYGLAHAATGGWPAVHWLAIAAYGAAVGASTLLAGRLGGPLAAGFVGAGLVVSHGLLQDVSLAYAVSWATLALAVAGLAVTQRQPAWIVAGLALALGALARQEVLLVTGAGAAVVFAGSVAGRLAGRPAIPRDAWWVLLGLLAVVVMAIHDWLLARDPLYSYRVPAIGAEGRDVRDLAGAARFLGAQLWDQIGLVVLALVGLVVLVRRRAWSIAVALAVLGPGTAAFFLAVAARGLVSLDRYLVPVDVAIVFAAGIGLAALAGALPTIRRSSGRAAVPVAVLAGALAAMVLAPRIGPLDAQLAARVALERRTAADWRRLLPELRAAAESVPAEPPAFRDPTARDVERPAVLVSARLLSMAAVDLDRRLDRIARLEPAATGPADLADLAGSVLYLDRGVSIAPDRQAWIVTTPPPTTPGAALVVAAQHAERAWVLRVEPR